MNTRAAATHTTVSAPITCRIFIKATASMGLRWIGRARTQPQADVMNDEMEICRE
jgi:hypothetical protein